MTDEKRTSFFSADNLHRAGWTAVVGLAGFVGASLYYRFVGPPKVQVETRQEVDQKQVNTQPPPQSAEIAALAKAIEQLARASTDSTNQKRLRELSSEVDRLRTELNNTKLPISTPIKPEPTLLPKPKSTASTDTPNTEPFLVPEAAKGYTVNEIFGVTEVACPPATVSKGSSLSAGFTLIDQTLLARASPIRVTVVRVGSPTSHFQIVERWYSLRTGPNAMSLTIPLEQGSHRLEVGFYLRDKLSGEYPPFYSKACPFQVI